MNLNNTYIIALFIFGLFLSSCEREQPQTISEVEVYFELPDSINDLAVLENKSYAGQEVKLKGLMYEYTATTDDEGKAVFRNVFPDKYNVATSWNLNEEAYKNLTGEEIQFELGTSMLIFGNKADLRIFSGEKIKQKTSFSLLKSLIISKIYYTMSKTTANKSYMVDTYIELYNNSSVPVSLNNLHLGLTESMSPPAFLSKNNPNDVYLRQVIRIPDGYELGGYQSFLIACRSAINHTIEAPNSVDLSKADLEVKNYDSEGNPTVKSSPIIFNSSGTLSFLNLTNNGGNGVVIFKTAEDITKWPKLTPPDKPTSNQVFLKVENRIIMDGVESLVYKATGVDVDLKRLNRSVDATYIYNTGGTYSNEACERKVEEVIEVDGNTYYKLMDTNNSMNDFAITKKDIRPRVYDKPELMPR